MNEPQRIAEFGWPGGDQPGELAFHLPVRPELVAALRTLLQSHLPDVQDTDMHALTPPLGAAGRYRLLTPDRVWFLRVSGEWNEPALEQAITRWLRDAGVPVNHLELAGIPFQFEGEHYRVDLRSFLDGRHFDGSLEDIRELARALGKCHAALRTFPQAGQVREFAARRFSQFDSTRDKMRAALEERRWALFAGDDWAEVNREWLDALVREYAGRFDLLPTAQCQHAQIHRANVVYTAEGQPVMVDFEDSVQTYAPVTWDLAYFVQRFCMQDGADSSKIAERLTAVREAYGAPLAGVAAMMRQIAWFSVVVLTDFHIKGTVNPRAEYDKFIRLEQQAREMTALLESYD